MTADPRDRDDAVLERLPQRLEHGPRELGQLVEQQDTAMREARLSGPWHSAAADDRRRRGAVMRRPERWREDDRPPRGQCPGDRVDPGHLERLVPRQRRQNARQPPAEHRLARSGRSCHEHVVLSRCRELERTAPALLAPHLGQVGQVRLLELVRARRSRERDLLLATQVGNCLGEVVHGHRVDARERGLGRRLGRADQALQALPARALGNRDRSRHRTDPAVERQLADAAVLEQPLRRELKGAGKKRQRNRKVESRPLLAQCRGSEVDRDPVPAGPRQHCVDDAAVNAVLRLLTGAIGEPDDGERRQVGGNEIRLDLDTARLESDDGGGESAGEHTTDGT